jgi:hypothetical protein
MKRRPGFVPGRDDRALIASLVNALEAQARTIETMGCTCTPTDGGKFHMPKRRRADSRCSGVRAAITYTWLAKRAHRRLAQRFPGESGYHPNHLTFSTALVAAMNEERWKDATMLLIARVDALMRRPA